MSTITVDTPQRIVVNITNHGQSTFEQMFLGQRYVIKPGETLRSVPWLAACLWFGDPDVRNSPRVPFRKQAFDSLRVRYGAYWDDDLWEERRPQCVVRDLDGKQIEMIVDDPQGSSLPDHPMADEKALLVEMLQAQQRQIDEMKARYEALTRAEPYEDAEVPDDAPPVAGKRGRGA